MLMVVAPVVVRVAVDLAPAVPLPSALAEAAEAVRMMFSRPAGGRAYPAQVRS